LKSLSHPQIPLYLDYFEVNYPTYKGFALVQTYISAQTIEQYLQAGRKFTEIEVKEIASSVLEILIYLHEMNPPVVHRDIKPSNILLGERSGNSVGSVYLIDFGSVQTVLAAEGGTRTVVGTYGYMPQEQFGGRTVPASDLYSLGCTIIYLVTGTNPADLPQKDFRIQFQQVANLSPSFANWLELMTEPILEKRFSSARQALSRLQNNFSEAIMPLESKRGDWYWDKNNWILKQQQQDKPAVSKIQLTKNEDALDITFPPVGFQSSMVFIGFFATFWNSFILVWTIGALSAPFPANIPFALFSLPFWGVGFSMIYGIVYGLFGGVSIYIDQQQIAFSYQLGKWKIPRRRSASRESINKLVYTPKYFTKDSDGDKTQVPAKLVIWAGVEKFEFDVNTFTIKSEVELEWLANELSDWLGIEITS
ncbi:serine/threonine protein kinase, partial [Dolichospermum sp. ST_sed9]|nr:serine/threonine protein kinase [Dolichospermum sp. ST_sed9]